MTWNHLPRVRCSWAMLLCGLVLTAEDGVAATAACIRESDRVRARQLGIAPGVLATGALNAITDVDGVLVGQTTLVEGDSVEPARPPFCRMLATSFKARCPRRCSCSTGSASRRA